MAELNLIGNQGLGAIPILPQAAIKPVDWAANFNRDVNAGMDLRTRIKNEPVEAAKRETALAENSLKQQQTAMQQRLLTALEKQLPPGATELDLKMAYHHYEITGGIPIDPKTGFIDFDGPDGIRTSANTAAKIKLEAAAKTAALLGQELVDGDFEDKNGIVWKTKIPVFLNPDGKRGLGEPLLVSVDEQATLTRQYIRQGGDQTGFQAVPGDLTSRVPIMPDSGDGGLGAGALPGSGGAGTLQMDPLTGKWKISRATDKSPTEAENKAAIAAASMWMEELNVLNQLQSGYDPTTYDLSSWTKFKQTSQNLLDRAIYRKGEGFIKDIASGSLQSDASKTYLPAMGNWVRQLMRYQSGAQIKPEEIQSALTDYFPLPGDTAEAVEQKRLRREVVRNVMSKVSGPQNEIFLHHLTSNIRVTHPELFAAPATKTPLPANSPLRKAPSPAPVDPKTGKPMVAPKAASTVPVTPVDDSAARFGQQLPGMLASPLKLFGRAGLETGNLLQEMGTTPSQVLNEVPGSLSLPLPSGVVNPITGAGALGTLGGSFLQNLINNNAMDFRSRHPDMTPPGVPATRTKRIILEDTTPTPPITPFGGFGRFLPY